VPDYLYFWGHTPAQPQVADKSCFSQWFPSPFSLAGVTYATAEHYMMAQKAALFGDTAVQARIVAAERPSEVKKLGREVANFDAKAWEAARAGIVFDGNFAKFSQRPRCANSCWARASASSSKPAPSTASGAWAWRRTTRASAILPAGTA
jgi:ribA/ribD-fused uncharacterized protein